MRGERKDLLTLEGRVAAELHGWRTSQSPRAHKFTDEERERGRKTQRQRGYFRGGKFTGRRPPPAEGAPE